MNQLANVLQELNVRKGDRVGVYLNRGLETAIAIYGIMQAGGIYVPLDGKSPIDLTLYLIEDCGIKIVISNDSQIRNIKRLSGVGSNIECFIGMSRDVGRQCISWDDVKSRSDTFVPDFRLLETDPAYIIYTSGSTGRPKGIVHSHYSGLSYARLSADHFNITSEDKIANHAPVFFDISLLGYFAAPLVGATTLIILDAYTILPASLNALIEKEKITIWYSVPLALVQLVQSGTLANNNSTLRWVCYAGEPFPPKYLSELMQLLPDANFSNKYGPAETNVCTYYNIPSIPENNDPIPIGNVWGNTEMLIVDEENEEVADGEIGELLIRSATTMLGYWQNPEMTERSMYFKTGSHGFQQRYYRTGDLVRQDSVGIIHFMGRKDHQIKTRGYRVELGAVEAVLVDHPKVSEAIVYALEQDDDTLTIAAAVTINMDEKIDDNELIAYMKRKLPYYAVPSKLTIMEKFPRTGSGKVNRPSVIEKLKKEK